MTTTYNNPKQVFEFILAVVQPFYCQLVMIILVACYWAAHVSIQPYIIKLILDRVSQFPLLVNMINPVLLYCGLSILSVMCFRLYDYACLSFYPKLKSTIIATVSERVSGYPYSFFQNSLCGEISNKIKDLSQGTAELIRIVLDRFLSHCLALIVSCFTLATVRPILALVFFIWAVILIGISFFTTKKARFLSRKFVESTSHVVGNLVDRFYNILNVHLFSAIHKENAELNKKLDLMVRRDVNLRWFLLKVMTVQGIMTVAMIGIAIFILIISLHTHQISVGDFGLVLILTLTFTDIVWHLAQEISNFSEMYGLISQGIMLLNQNGQILNNTIIKPLQIKKGEIEFREASFSYPNSKPLLQNESITIQAGQKVGLVGCSGSGKSTFLSLLLRLFDLDSGHIYIDGQDITQFTRNSLYNAVSVVSEYPILFHRSIIENILYGNMNASKEEVVSAAKKALAHEFILSLPHGYDTGVGERGVKISNGQRQRIAIARAILKNAPILLFDEATSALDPITEACIEKNLLTLAKDKTMIVIAHKFLTLLHMDRILVFDEGKIVGDGTHIELLDKNSLYRKLWDVQVSSYNFENKVNLKFRGSEIETIR